MAIAIYIKIQFKQRLILADNQLQIMLNVIRQFILSNNFTKFYQGIKYQADLSWYKIHMTIWQTYIFVKQNTSDNIYWAQGSDTHLISKSPF